MNIHSLQHAGLTPPGQRQHVVVDHWTGGEEPKGTKWSWTQNPDSNTSKTILSEWKSTDCLRSYETGSHVEAVSITSSASSTAVLSRQTFATLSLRHLLHTGLANIRTNHAVRADGIATKPALIDDCNRPSCAAVRPRQRLAVAVGL